MPYRPILKHLIHIFCQDSWKSPNFQTKKNKSLAWENYLTYPACHYFFSFKNVVFAFLPTYLYARCHPFYSFFLMASLSFLGPQGGFRGLFLFFQKYVFGAQPTLPLVTMSLILLFFFKASLSCFCLVFESNLDLLLLFSVAIVT